MNYYLLIIWGDLEPELEGPFDTEEDRDIRAKKFREEEGDEHGLYMLNSEGEAEVNAYSGEFFEE